MYTVIGCVRVAIGTLIVSINTVNNALLSRLVVLLGTKFERRDQIRYLFRYVCEISKTLLQVGFFHRTGPVLTTIYNHFYHYLVVTRLRLSTYNYNDNKIATERERKHR